MTAVPYTRAVVPVRTVNGTNAREHWGARKRRAARERGVTRLVLGPEVSPVPGEVTVHLCRVSTGTMDDDGLRAACKHVRDEIAALLQRDDDPESGIEWVYTQRRGPRGYHAVEVVIEVERDG